jgi:allantoicase
VGKKYYIKTTIGIWCIYWNSGTNSAKIRAIIKLGFSGSFKGFDIDTHYFTGNQAPFASIDAAIVPVGADAESAEIQWTEILPKVELPPTQHNVFVLKEETSIYTHLRVNNIPDGGIARFRAYGNVSPIWPEDKK